MPLDLWSPPYGIVTIKKLVFEIWLILKPSLMMAAEKKKLSCLIVGWAEITFLYSPSVGNEDTRFLEAAY